LEDADDADETQINADEGKNQKNDLRRSALRSICVIRVPIFVIIGVQTLMRPAS